MMSKWVNAAAAIMITCCLSSCSSVTNAETPINDVPFSIIAAGTDPISGVDKNRKLEILRDQASFNARLAEYVQPAQEYTVDFSAKRVVLSDMGQRNTGGFAVATTRVQEYADYVMVYITLTKPGSTCAVTQAFTAPFEFIEVQSTKEILITEQQVITNCN